jgi:hypothetical protein
MEGTTSASEDVFLINPEMKSLDLPTITTSIERLRNNIQSFGVLCPFHLLFLVCNEDISRIPRALIRFGLVAPSLASQYIANFRARRVDAGTRA